MKLWIKIVSGIAALLCLIPILDFHLFFTDFYWWLDMLFWFLIFFVGAVGESNLMEVGM